MKFHAPPAKQIVVEKKQPLKTPVDGGAQVDQRPKHKVTLNTSPQWSWFTVDNDATNYQTPGTIELSAGPHTIHFTGNEYFPPTNWQISNIHAGTGAQNIIPGMLQVDFNFRFSTESTPESLKARVDTILQRHGLEYSIDWVQGGRPFLTRRGKLVETLTAVVERVSGVKPQINCTGGTSDGRFIFDICPEVAEFGPVNRSIHKVNEAVALEEVEPLSEIYRQALEELLGSR